MKEAARNRDQSTPRDSLVRNSDGFHVLNGIFTVHSSLVWQPIHPIWDRVILRDIPANFEMHGQVPTGTIIPTGTALTFEITTGNSRIFRPPRNTRLSTWRSGRGDLGALERKEL